MKLIKDLPFLDYIKRTDHFSNHMFKYLDECPQALRDALDNPEEEEKQDYLFGELFDIAVQDLDQFTKLAERNEKVMDKIVKTNGKFKVGYRAYDKILAMVERTLNHPGVSKILARGDWQVSIFTELNGVKVKSRPDFLPSHVPIIPDFKTTKVTEPTPRALRNESAKYKYYRQGAFYLAQQPERIVFTLIWVPKSLTPRPVVEEIALDDPTLAFGKWEYEKHLHTYQECVRTNVWPGHWKVRKHEIPRCLMVESGYLTE